MTTGPYRQQVCRNTESGKVHLITNIRIESTDQKPITKYLQEYLYEFIEGEVSREQWRDGFDDAACGVRSVWSVKVGTDKTTREKNVLTSTARYVPSDPADKLSAQTLWKYSIYNCVDTVHFNVEAITCIDEFIANRKIAAVPADLSTRASVSRCLV